MKDLSSLSILEHNLSNQVISLSFPSNHRSKKGLEDSPIDLNLLCRTGSIVLEIYGISFMV